LNTELQHIFSFPTIKSFSDNLALISKSTHEKISPAPKKEYYECTINQKRLWLIQQSNPQSTTQNESLIIDCRYPVSLSILIKALHFLIERHETFRTNFIEIHGEPKQVIQEKINPGIEVYDLAQESNPTEVLERIVRENENIPFTLDSGHLFSLAIFKISNGHWKINFIMHHILTDGWSNEIIKNELLEICYALDSHKSPKLPSLFIQNKDYAEYQKTILTEEKLLENRSYWHSVLGNKFPKITLPKDKPYTPGRKNSGSMYRVFINKDIYSRMRALSNTESVSVYTILLAGLNIVIGDICDRKDLVISSAFSERTLEETRNVVGYFISPLLLRAKINPDLTCHDFLHITRNNITEAIKHHDYPIEKLLDELNIQFDYSEYFVTPVSLNMINYIDNNNNPTELKKGHVGDLGKEVEYELDLEAIEYPNCIELNCVYKNEIFSTNTISAIMNTYVSVLDQISTNPHSFIKNISTSNTLQVNS